MYYLVSLLYGASTSFIAPIYVVFLLNRGLDYKGVALIDGFFSVSIALLDYPTGGIADKYGRGRTTALACLFLGLGLLSYSFSRNLYQFLFSEFLAAVGAALYSGAFTAWLVDSLKEENRDRDLSVVFGNAEVLSLIVSSTGSLIGGLVAEYSLELPFALGSLLCFTAVPIALILTRGRGEVYSKEERRYTDFLRSGIHVFLRNKPLILLTLATSLMALARPSFTLTWAPYMECLGAEKWLLGLTGSLFMAIMGLGSYMGGRLAVKLGYRLTSCISVVFISSSLLAILVANNPYVFIISSLPLEAGLGLMIPTMDAWINRYIPSRERATVISLRRTLIIPFRVLGTAAMGILSDLESPRLAYIFAFAVNLLALPLYIKVKDE